MSRALKQHPVQAQHYPLHPSRKMVIDPISQKPIVMPEEITRKTGPMINAMAATTAARLARVRTSTIMDSMRTFRKLPHRLEPIARIGSVAFINDSKATNTNAAWYALDLTPAPIVWIMGGIDKGNDYEALLPLVREKVAAIVCVAKDPAPFQRVFGDIVPFYATQDMNEAVRKAYELAPENAYVLLSPACASFDLFENYEARGEAFRRAVQLLQESLSHESHP